MFAQHGVMELPSPIRNASYSGVHKAISSTAVIKSEAAMKDAANKLSNICLGEDPEST